MSRFRLFISYSRKDLENVSPIVSRIQKEYGIEAWIDLKGIESGKQFINVIVSAIDDSPSVLFMLSSNSLHSSFCKNELTYAHLRGKRIFMLSIDGTQRGDWVEDLCSQECFYDLSDLDICIEDILLLPDNDFSGIGNINGHDFVAPASTACCTSSLCALSSSFSMVYRCFRSFMEPPRFHTDYRHYIVFLNSPQGN